MTPISSSRGNVTTLEVEALVASVSKLCRRRLLYNSELDTTELHNAVGIDGASLAPHNAWVGKSVASYSHRVYLYWGKGAMNVPGK
ncbi:hypothetical protein CEXT_703751 [Caerostris extrusa]|uniref:Uncharacterized protein n=1 Tax=Caerostris extrusa TaxID=172846 RepID=A0AAV4UZZ7_CAEEX|nr:hypothetical protein CEXT_703751 [Caerostris extrusa]